MLVNLYGRSVEHVVERFTLIDHEFSDLSKWEDIRIRPIFKKVSPLTSREFSLVDIAGW